MKSALLLAAALCACNSIDGADKYTKGDAPASCDPSCIDTSGACLGDCAATRDSCKATCGNPGACNKCDSNYSTCTSGCVSTCTACGCTQSACETAPQPSDAGADGD